MKIGIILTDIAGAGGIERVTSLLSNELVSAGHEVAIISIFHKKEQTKYEFNPQIKIAHIVDADYNLSDISKIERAKYVASAIRNLRKYLKSVKFDVIITQAFLPTFILAATRNRTPNIVCEHFKYGLYSPLATKIRNLIYSKRDCVVTLTDDDRDQYRAAGIQAVTIPNMTTFTPCRNNFSGKRIIAVGRLANEKGFDMLIRAMSVVNLKHPDWHLDIYGDGPDRQKLQDDIDLLSLNHVISLRGYSDNIRSELLNSSFSVMSSRHEAFPMAILESMAMGLPCVAFDCKNGPKQMLKDGAGILVPPENVKELANAINRLIESPKLLEDCKNQAYISILQYMPDKIMNQWHNLLSTFSSAPSSS